MSKLFNRSPRPPSPEVITLWRGTIQGERVIIEWDSGGPDPADPKLATSMGLHLRKGDKKLFIDVGALLRRAKNG